MRGYGADTNRQNMTDSWKSPDFPELHTHKTAMIRRQVCIHQPFILLTSCRGTTVGTCGYLVCGEVRLIVPGSIGLVRCQHARCFAYQSSLVTAWINPRGFNPLYCSNKPTRAPIRDAVPSTLWAMVSSIAFRKLPAVQLCRMVILHFCSASAICPLKFIVNGCRCSVPGRAGRIRRWVR